jgi:hypothetical protein
LRAPYYLLFQMAACQLHLRRSLHLVEGRHLAHTAVAEAEKMGSVDVVISDTAEVEQEAGTTTDPVVCLLGSGEEAKPHQTESLALEEEEVEGMAVIGMDEGGDGGSWK